MLQLLVYLIYILYAEEKVLPKVKKVEKKVIKKVLKPVQHNSLVDQLKRGKGYKMMTLAKDMGYTRQYCNFMLNKGVSQGLIRRDGTRKWYVYFKV